MVKIIARGREIWIIYSLVPLRSVISVIVISRARGMYGIYCIEARGREAARGLSAINGVGAKPGLWTLDWTHGLDCGLRFGLDFGLMRWAMTTISNNKLCCVGGR